MRRRGNYILLLLLSLAFVGCTEELSVKNEQDDKEIVFSAQLGISADVTRSIADVQTLQLTDGAQPLYLHRIVEPWGNITTDITRATLVNPTETNTTPTGFTFGVSGYTYNTTTGSTLTDRTANFFYNKLVQRQGVEGFWKTVDASYYWPTGGDKLAFYAYYPYQTDNTDEIIKVYGDGSSNNDTAPLKIHYKVNGNLSSQQDLMTAYATNQTFDQTAQVPLIFYHALTAVNIELGDNVSPGLLKYVAFNNVFNEGVLTVSGNDGTKPQGTWNFSGMSTSTIKMDYTTDGTNGGFNTETDGTSLINEPMFVVPQSFSNNNQTISIVLNDSEDGNDIEGAHPLSMPLTSLGNWVAGQHITYLINTNSINVVHMESVTYPTSWGDDPFSIKTNYVDGDMIGVFAVGEDGKVIKANKPYRYNGTNWIDTDVNETLLYSPTTTYYLYYPYREELTGARTVGSSFITNPSSANVEDDFFSDVISNWTVSADQSTKEKLLANDLQIAKATTGTKTLRIKATMKHVMGLSKLTLGYKKVTASVYYTAGGTSTGDPYTREGQSVYIAATEQLATSSPQPCLHELDYYYITNGNQNLTFSSVQGLYNTWKENVTATTSNGACCSCTAYPNDNVANYTYQGKYYNYINNTVQTLEVLHPNYYGLEVWGAQGGDISSKNWIGGRGGYSIGIAPVGKEHNLYICVGGKGVGGAHTTYNGGYNGGGNASTTNNDGNELQASGGGCTSITKENRGVLANFKDYKDDVFIVAGGGGGAGGNTVITPSGYCKNGNGGGLEGGNGTTGVNGHNSTGGTQTAGGTSTVIAFARSDGSFGLGGYGFSGGGGGWYGGSGNINSTSGGSGYIGGVIDGITIAGNGTTSFANTGASGTETAHTGDGYARIIIPIPMGE